MRKKWINQDYFSPKVYSLVIAAYKTAITSERPLKITRTPLQKSHLQKVQGLMCSPKRRLGKGVF
jgi:hypothetical protein